MAKFDASKALFFSSIALLIFSYGVAVPVFGLFPNDLLVFVRDSVTEVYNERQVLMGTKPVDHVHRARHAGTGVTRHVVGKPSPGSTLLAGFFDGDLGLRLIRLDGSVINRWPVRFYDLFPNVDHIRPAEFVPATNWNTMIHGALALPDGSVVFNFDYKGLVKLDRCGTPVWRLPYMTHHSVERSADGGYWVPGRRFPQSATEFAPLKAPLHEDLVLKVSADGKIIRKISVPGLLLKNGLWPEYLKYNLHKTMRPEPELVHMNDVEELSDDKAPGFPLFSSGDLVVSLRDLNLILVFDPATEVIKWYESRPWVRQHDPDFQPNGIITVFDNRNDGRATGKILGGSRVVAMETSAGKSWLLPKTDTVAKFYTRQGGKHEVLPNGNILIAEMEGGRVLEIDETGSVVWEYVNRYDEDEVAEIVDAVRYPEDYFSVRDWSCD